VPTQPASADEYVRTMGEFYRGVQSFSVQAKSSTLIEGEDGQPLAGLNQPSFSRALTVQRPNRVTVRDDTGQAPSVTSDGENFVAYMPSTSKYLETPAPASFDALIKDQLSMAFGGGLQVFVLHLAAADPLQALLENVTSTEYVGQEDLNGNAAHRIRLTQEQRTPFGNQEMQWQMWIAAEGQPLLLQVRFDQGTQQIQLPGREPQKITIAAVEAFDRWQIDAPLADDAFAAVVPDGARRAGDLQDLFTPVPPLLGEAAPPIKLALLEEGELDLANHAGKEVVMLDFWATWCGPCRAEMPVLAEIAEEFKDKGVVLYAVNLREEPDEIREFLTSQDLNTTVALDKEGTVAGEYGVDGIPHLVVIDKNGVVQAVHVGLSPNLKRELQRELSAVLDGQDIVNNPLPPEVPEADEGEGGNPLQNLFRKLDKGAKAAGGKDAAASEGTEN
jgi:thiol-disulfide isomerase/thioredoxin